MVSLMLKTSVTLGLSTIIIIGCASAALEGHTEHPEATSGADVREPNP